MSKPISKLLPVSIGRYLMMYPECTHLDSDLVLTDMESFRLPLDTRYMECVALMLCLSGSGSYTIGAMRHTVGENDVIIVGQHQVLGDISYSDDFKAEVMLVSHDMLQSAVHDLGCISNIFVMAIEHPVFHLTPEQTLMFHHYYQLMKEKVDQTNHTFRREISVTFLAAMVYELSDAMTKANMMSLPVAMRSHKMFMEFIKLVEHNFRKNRRVAWYAEQLQMTPKALLEMVKRVSNRTPNEWLDIYTVTELRNLLRHTTLSMKEIAERLCFSSQGSMGKFFKEHVGISPTTYRAS